MYVNVYAYVAHHTMYAPPLMPLRECILHIVTRDVITLIFLYTYLIHVRLHVFCISNFLKEPFKKVVLVVKILFLTSGQIRIHVETFPAKNKPGTHPRFGYFFCTNIHSRNIADQR